MLLIEEPVILTVSFLLEVQSNLSKILLTSGNIMSKVEPHFSSIDSRIFRRILHYFGYQIKFKSLLEEKLIVPTEDVMVNYH